MHPQAVRDEALVLLRTGLRDREVGEILGVPRATVRDWRRTPSRAVRIVETHPDRFLRGLFHSDGSRVRNWASQVVAGEPKRYEYPRWQFCNSSEDILGLCTWALDLAGVDWRRSNRVHVSVSRREAVARLDALIGPKS